MARDPRGVRVVRRAVDAALYTLGINDVHRSEITLALDEACTNVAQHAAPARTYQVSVEVDDGHCQVEVTDDGGGFTLNPATFDRPPPDATDGRGIYLIAALADTFHIRTSPGSGTTVRFSKHLPNPMDHNGIPGQQTNRKLAG